MPRRQVGVPVAAIIRVLNPFQREALQNIRQAELSRRMKWAASVHPWFNCNF
jgi:hypothetical protein